MEINYIEMGRRVRRKRRELGLTQEQLAEQVGLSTSFIGFIERGEKAPSLDTMAKLADVLDMTLDYLVCGVRLRCERADCPLFGGIRGVLEEYGLTAKE